MWQHINMYQYAPNDYRYMPMCADTCEIYADIANMLKIYGHIRGYGKHAQIFHQLCANDC